MGVNMNYIISIIEPKYLDKLLAICAELNINLCLNVQGSGTATMSMMELLGIESNDKQVVFISANDDLTYKLIEEQRKHLYIDAPGHGVVITVPIKSIGGAKALSNLNGGNIQMKKPKIDLNYELIVAIANVGTSDMVMNAARQAGATGGTVVHAKGTNSDDTKKFFNVSLADEKELILIVSEIAKKADIMSSIIEKAGSETEAAALVFSLPVSAVQGFGFENK